ncbi:MAG TPA: alkaline phosphatase family protein [Thermoplasmata archaeon]
MTERRRWTRRDKVIVAIVIIAILVLAGMGFEIATRPPATAGGFAPEIDHVVFILLENRPYDQYFAGYCLVLSVYCNDTGNGIPAGTREPQLNVTGDYVVPYNYTDRNFTIVDQGHTYKPTIASIDGGKMDGFYSAEKSGLDPFGHFNGSTLPVYWDLAQEYALGDDFFSSALSYSLPNHWYALAGQAPATFFDNTSNVSIETKHTYLNEANQTETIQDLLNATNVTWKYYDWALDPYQEAIDRTLTGNDVGSAYAFWNPLAARYESYDQYFVAHFSNRANFFTDVTNGNLPDISWVIPETGFSDHPPANVTVGEEFVATVIDSVEMSRYWPSTAIFLSWDDYGGFYDHVVPPRIDPLGLSIRVPFLVISPYTPAGTIIHTLGYFESTLAFMEHRWNLGCIGVRDCNAPDLLSYFNFDMGPRPPIFFDPNWLNDSYPMTTQHFVPLNTTGWAGGDVGLTDTEAD